MFVYNNFNRVFIHSVIRIDKTIKKCFYGLETYLQIKGKSFKASIINIEAQIVNS